MKSNDWPGAFGDLPETFSVYEDSAIALLPVPYDGTSTWMKGADRGPAAILEASGHMELYDIETDSEVYLRGMVTLPPVVCPQDPQSMVSAVSKRARSVLEDGKFLVGIGGEHSVTIGLVQAQAERHPELSVLQMDAHADLREEYEGSPYNHACVMARVRERCPIVQAGIRSMDVSEKELVEGERVFYAHHLCRDIPGAAARIAEVLTEKVYITIDLDVLNPAFMPSTGTPEPGGLDWYALLNILDRVIREKQVVGFDVTELLPNPHNKGPDFLAAKLIYRVLSRIFASHGPVIQGRKD